MFFSAGLIDFLPVIGRDVEVLSTVRCNVGVAVALKVRIVNAVCPIENDGGSA
ncbi:hypothetical protein SDC9_81061 [bioreactor metagenome]|uniref:Uncharacterized protein n=1 Tax=bioreactor metagenome TaxID=1076179 RepID=A0A644Z2H1_9ZZZZ